MGELLEMVLSKDLTEAQGLARPGQYMGPVLCTLHASPATQSSFLCSLPSFFPPPFLPFSFPLSSFLVIKG